MKATRRLNTWFKNIETSGIIQHQRLARTIHRHLYRIHNYFKHKLANTASKAFNNKTGLLKIVSLCRD